MDFESAPATVTRLITVRAGDCLWSIAQRYLGAGDRYPEIVRLNYGHDMGDGLVFTNPSLIEPGWQLLVPGGSPAGAGHTQGAGGSTGSAGVRGRATAAGSTPAGLRQPSSRASGQRSALPPAPPGRADGSELAAADGAAAVRVGSGAGASGAARDPGGQQARAPAETRADYETVRERARLRDRTGGCSGLRLRSAGRRGADQPGPAAPPAAARAPPRPRGSRCLPIARVLAAEQRLRAAAPDEPLETLRDALPCLESGIVGCGPGAARHRRPARHPGCARGTAAAPAADGPPPPYAISPGRQGMCWQLDLPATCRSSQCRQRQRPEPAGRIGFAGLAVPPAAGPDHGRRHRGGLPAARPGVRCRSWAVTGRPPWSTRSSRRSRRSWRPASGAAGMTWYSSAATSWRSSAALEHCATSTRRFDRLQARCAAVAHADRRASAG